MPLAFADRGSDLADAIEKRKKKDDPFAALKPIGDALGNAGVVVGGVMAEARKLPVVGGALDALSAVGDATYKTPIGLAALGADAVLGTGLSGAAQRANAGRPWWELPKTAANVASDAFGKIAEDEQQTPLARAIAGLTRGTEQVGGFVAPIPGAAGAARLAGRGANALPGALENTVGKPAPGAGVFASRRAAPVSAGRTAPKGPEDAPHIASAKKQIAESLARQRADMPTPDELAVRAPISRRDLENMRRRGDPIAGMPKTAKTPEPEPEYLTQLKDSLRARGVDPDTLEKLPKAPPAPRPASEFIKSKPDKMTVHDANEAAVSAMHDALKTGDLSGVEAALKRVEEAGGSIAHTAQRMRAAGLPVPTVGELTGMARSRAAGNTPLGAAITKRTAKPRTPRAAKPAPAAPIVEAPAAPAAAATSNVYDFAYIKEMKAKNAETIAEMNRKIAAARASEAARTAPPPPPSGPPAPPAGATPPVPPATGLDKFLSVWNLPKAIKASLDLSAPFRQGILLSAGHPGEFFGAFKPMLQAAKDAKFAKALDTELRATERPGLYLAPIDNATLGAREEAFMSSFADKIPGVSASNRAYVTFLNKLRADVYDNVLEGWNAGGKTVTDADKIGLGDVINHFTGRGDIPLVSERTASVLNGLFFSPRFVASRFQSIGDALGVVKSPSSLAAREAAQNMVKFVGAGLTILTLAKLNGLQVELDPRAAAFGKIQWGPHQVDIWGGEQQVARYTAQFITGQGVIGSGKNAGQVRDIPRGTTASRFIRSKLSPSMGKVNDVLGVVGGGGPSAKDRKANAGKPLTDQVLGRNFIGEPVTAGNLPGDLLAPLGPANAIEAIGGDDDKVRGTVVALLNMLGFGTNTFDSETPATAPPTTPAGTFRLTPPGGTTTTPPATGTFQLRPPAGAPAGPGAPTVPTFRLQPPGGGTRPTNPAFNAPQGAGAPRPPGDVQNIIATTAQAQGIDHRLALATAFVESNFDPNAVGDTDTPYSSHGNFQERLRVGRGGFTTPDPDPARQTERFAADVRAALAAGFKGTPGQLAAAVQRPLDPVAYARKVDAAYGSFR